MGKFDRINGGRNGATAKEGEERKGTKSNREGDAYQEEESEIKSRNNKLCVIYICMCVRPSLREPSSCLLCLGGARRGEDGSMCLCE